MLGGRPDDGTDDWEEGNALLCSLFMETIPASIYYRIRLNTAHENYKYLAKCFRNNDPIEVLCAKKFAARTNEAKRDPSAEIPTSENAATGADREDPPTKDLTRGIEDVDDRNVGRTEDPHTSLEASAKGTSAESAGTTVQLESAPHETQDQPQDSPQVTPRLPTKGKPSECKREVVESVVTAEHTIGTVETAEPRETIADVNRTALLGRDLAERACGVDEGGRKVADVDGKAALGRELAERVHVVDEGTKMERGRQSRLQQTNCEANGQRNANANANIPNAHGLPLEGEWEVYASGGLMNSSEGCNGGAGERASVDDMDGDPGRELERIDAQNELTQLLTTTVEPYVNDGDTNACVHLKCTSWRAGDTNGVGDRTDGSKGQADVSRGRADESKGWTDTLDVANGAETTGVSHGDGAGTYLSVRDAKRVVNATDGVGSQLDASSGHWDVPSVETDAITPENAPENVSIPRKREKPPDSPMETAKRTPDVPNGSGSHADASSVHTDTHCVGNETETTENAPKNVRTRRIERKAENSPNGRDIATPEVPSRWRKVSIGGGDVYVPCNAPVAAIETTSRWIVFGRVESGVEAIAPSVKGERAGDGDGDRYEGDGDVDGTTSSGHIDSSRVEEALLATESQHTRSSRILRRNDLPVSSRPPVQRERRPYGSVRRRRRRGRLKIERINEDQVSQTQQVETTHLRRAHAVQPLGNDPKRAYGVVRPRHRRGRIKIAPTNVSRTRNGGNAYLGRVIAIWSTRRPKKRIRRVKKLTFEYRKQGEPWRDDGDYG